MKCKRKSIDTNIRSAILDMANALKPSIKRYSRAARKKAWEKISGTAGQKKMKKFLDDPNRSVNMFAKLAFREWLEIEAYQYWDGAAGEYKKANILIFWADGGSPKLQGKVGGMNWDQYMKNADAGYGVVYFIEAPSKASALEIINKGSASECPNHKNVYYYGIGAAHALGITTY